MYCIIYEIVCKDVEGRSHLMLSVGYITGNSFWKSEQIWDLLVVVSENAWLNALENRSILYQISPKREKNYKND